MGLGFTFTVLCVAVLTSANLTCYDGGPVGLGELEGNTTCPETGGSQACKCRRSNDAWDGSRFSALGCTESHSLTTTDVIICEENKNVKVDNTGTVLAPGRTCYCKTNYCCTETAILKAKSDGISKVSYPNLILSSLGCCIIYVITE